MYMEDLDLPREYVTLPNPINRELFFTQQVDQESIGNLTRQLIRIQNHDEYLRKLYSVHNLDYKPFPIKIYIDSYGGDIYQCFGLLSIMEASETPIQTIVTGTAMSCGFLIALHGHERYAYPKATLMYHSVQAGGGGTARDLEEQLVEVLRLQRMIEDITAEKSKIPRSKMREIFEAKADWYMTAEVALQFGCIDKIIGKDREPLQTLARAKSNRARVNKPPVELNLPSQGTSE
jgi:ATP-dependent Clp protease protease subunit